MKRWSCWTSEPVSVQVIISRSLREFPQGSGNLPGPHASSGADLQFSWLPTHKEPVPARSLVRLTRSSSLRSACPMVPRGVLRKACRTTKRRSVCAYSTRFPPGRSSQSRVECAARVAYPGRVRRTAGTAGSARSCSVPEVERCCRHTKRPGAIVFWAKSYPTGAGEAGSAERVRVRLRHWGEQAQSAVPAD